MTATYDAIATETLTSGQSTVTFNNISGNYTDLVLVFYYRDARNQKYAYPYIRFNNDTGANYSLDRFSGDGSTAVGTRADAQVRLNIGEGAGALSPTGEFSPIIVNIMNYSNSTTHKTVIIRSGNYSGDGGLNVGTQVGVWNSTNAITRIDVGGDAGGATNIVAGSMLTLYGIKAE